jgi:DNA (cytosine-5)-methyltransferase 1
MTTFASLFSGFGGADIGAIAAGLNPIWAVEYEADIAAVYRDNLGDHVTVADILTLDPKDFERPDFLHASPPCPNFSNAKANGEETEHDIALAQKVADFVTVLLPDFFTLENVYQYRESKSWGIIALALMTAGYSFNYWHCNMADWGVPQTRKRMIVIARRDGIRPMLPPATHAESPEVGLFGTLKKWIGWYEAIEDLIPDLPVKKLRVRKSVAHLVQHLPRRFVLDNTQTNPAGMSERALNYRIYGEPVFTIPATTNIYVSVDGRTTEATPRALARFQSFPDSYILPDSKRLACRGIGNACPPLFMQRLYESLRETP